MRTFAVKLRGRDIKLFNYRIVFGSQIAEEYEVYFDRLKNVYILYFLEVGLRFFFSISVGKVSNAVMIDTTIGRCLSKYPYVPLLPGCHIHGIGVKIHPNAILCPDMHYSVDKVHINQW